MLQRLFICLLALTSLPTAWAARGTASASQANAIINSNYGPLSGSGGPFTIAFWFQSGNVNALPSYLAEGYGAGQWAVIYGYTSHQIEFYTGNPTIRQNTGIAISDSGWHHVAYRRSSGGNSSWDKFLDGAKTTINSSIAFSLPSVNSFYTFNANNFSAPCQCSLADVVFYSSALPDTEIQSLAGGSRPPSLVAQPVLYWPLEGTSSPEPDVSGNNHPGTIMGNVAQVANPPYGIGSSVGSVARGTANASDSDVIVNSTYGPLSSSNGPFTIAFWFQSANVNPGRSYIAEAYGGGQWSVIYGYASQQIEFYTGDPSVRQNTGITITDTAWHHVAYRKSAAGNSSWDKFLDGAKVTINSSANFSLPFVSSLYVLNAANDLAPCQCNIADFVVYNSARPDMEIRGLAAGLRPILTPGPLLYWPLSATSSLEPDASGNNHPGSVDGSIGAVSAPPTQCPKAE